MSIKSKIQALITSANATTGESDTTLTDAMQTLVDGYGQGGGGGNYNWQTYTGTLVFNNEIVAPAIIPVNATGAVAVQATLIIKRTGIVSDGIVTYDDVPINRGSNLCLAWMLSYLANSLNGSFIYRYGTSAPAAGESASTAVDMVRYRAGNAGTRLAGFNIITDASSLLTANGIMCELGNATRAFCSSGLYMEFDYVVKVLKEVIS